MTEDRLQGKVDLFREKSADLFETLEAEGHLPAGSIANFGPILGFRNRIVHLCDRVEERVVCDILVRERQDLAKLLDLLLAALSDEP